MLLISSAWSVDLLQIYVLLFALRIQTLPIAGSLVLLAVNLAIALPAAPANGGTHELGTLVALHAIGVPIADALAFAMLYHALQVVPLAMVGIVGAGFWLRPEQKAHDADEGFAVHG
jgi:uncharacterized membrane protein YbhN (UPF0104 family)